MGVPPDPRAWINERYPLRQYDVRLHDLIGWADDKVIATFGQPDSREPGSLWPLPENARNAEGRLLTGCLTVTEEGEILHVHPFGMRPQKIELPLAYERWRYDNVRGSNWLLYLTRQGVTTRPDPPVSWDSLPSEPPVRSRSFWQRMVGRSRKVEPRNPMSTRKYVPRGLPTLSGPLMVAEVGEYPTGAVF